MKQRRHAIEEIIRILRETDRGKDLETALLCEGCDGVRERFEVNGGSLPPK